MAKITVHKKCGVFSHAPICEGADSTKVVRKKTWPIYFNKILKGDKNCELRLADFDLKEGDTFILEEWDPKIKNYTGRKIEKTVKHLTHVFPLDFASPRELAECGQYLIELE